MKILKFAKSLSKGLIWMVSIHMMEVVPSEVTLYVLKQLSGILPIYRRREDVFHVHMQDRNHEVERSSLVMST